MNSLQTIKRVQASGPFQGTQAFWPRLWPLLLCAVLLVGGAIGSAQGAVLTLTDATPELSLAGGLEVFEDPSATAELADILTQRFTPLPAGYAGGYRASRVWFRFTVGSQATVRDWVLLVGVPFLGNVDLYTPQADGSYRVSHQGEMVPSSEREIATRGPAFAVTLEPGQQKTFYMAVKSQGSLAVEARLLQKPAFDRYEHLDTVIISALCSLSLYVLLFSLLNVISSPNYLNFAFLFYATLSILIHFYTDGVLSQYLWDDMGPFIAMVPAQNALMISAGYWLTDALLEMSRHYPRISRFFRVMGGLGLGAAVMGVFVGNDVMGPLAGWVLLLLIAISLPASLILLLRRKRGAALFLISLLAMMTVSVMILLRNIGIVDPGVVLPYSQHLGAVCQMVILALGLVEQGRSVERERRLAQASLLDAARSAERKLEERIEQRTHALAQANMALATEIIERRQIEEKLRESEQQVRAIVDAAPFPMVVFERLSGRCLFLNAPAGVLLRLDAAEGVRQLPQGVCRDLFPSEAPVLGREVHLRLEDQLELWVLLSAVPLRYGDIPATLVCLNDISARKELENRLLNAREQAEQALDIERRARREQRNFLAMVSHEFRVPLAIVETAAQILQLTLPAQNSDALEEVAKLHRAVSRMTDLINTCLADDWLDSAMMSLRLENIDLVWLIEDVCEELAALVPAERLQVEVPDHVSLRGDATLIRVVLSNLVDNALKYSPDSEAVRVVLWVSDGFAHLEVYDRGPGIAPLEREQIFDKFFRSPSVGRIGGAGLGLYVVRRIVVLHSGAISCGPGSDGVGSVFRVNLPLLVPKNDVALAVE